VCVKRVSAASERRELVQRVREESEIRE
jgi:hypothetical protein